MGDELVLEAMPDLLVVGDPDDHELLVPAAWMIRIAPELGELASLAARTGGEDYSHERQQYSTSMSHRVLSLERSSVSDDTDWPWRCRAQQTLLPGDRNAQIPCLLVRVEQVAVPAPEVK